MPFTHHWAPLAAEGAGGHPWPSCAARTRPRCHTTEQSGGNVDADVIHKAIGPLRYAMRGVVTEP